MSTRFDFAGRRVLVTGGTSGIGHGVAHAFAETGAEVIVTGTRASASEYDVDLGPFDFRPLDVRDHDAIDELAASLDRLDVLVNNAGAASANEGEPDGFEDSVNVNLFAAHRLSQGCKALLGASGHDGGGAVVNVSSMSAFRPVVFVPGYGAAKAAVIQMTGQLGLMWAADNIRVNAVAPGLILTGMTDIMKDVPEIADPELAKVPMARWGHPSDVAPAFLFLASPDARFITGQTLNVDGGYSLT